MYESFEAEASALRNSMATCVDQVKKLGRFVEAVCEKSCELANAEVRLSGAEPFLLGKHHSLTSDGSFPSAPHERGKT